MNETSKYRPIRVIDNGLFVTLELSLTGTIKCRNKIIKCFAEI